MCEWCPTPQKKKEKERYCTTGKKKKKPLVQTVICISDPIRFLLNRQKVWKRATFWPLLIHFNPPPPPHPCNDASIPNLSSPKTATNCKEISFKNSVCKNRVLQHRNTRSHESKWQANCWTCCSLAQSITAGVRVNGPLHKTTRQANWGSH